MYRRHFTKLALGSLISTAMPEPTSQSRSSLSRALFYRHPLFSLHRTNSTSMEHPRRLKSIHSHLQGATWYPEAYHSTNDLCYAEAWKRVHPEAFLLRLKKEIDSGARSLSDEPRNTFVSSVSLDAALAVSGAAVHAVDQMIAGRTDVAFVAGRPPGHHAGRQRAGGYCLLNHVAIAAMHALASGMDRVFILDIDVHHGNGTQEIFWREERVFVCSLHQKGLYPMPQHGVGHSHERGEGKGRGTNLNIPLFAGTTPDRYLAALNALAIPALDRYKPDLILLSAGFDAHHKDPQGGMRLETETFRTIGERLAERANAHQIPIVSLLEGGYHTRSLGESYLAHVEGLLRL